IGASTGGTVDVDGIKVTFVNAEHSCGITDGDQLVYGGLACGLVIEFENGYTIYFAGDTDVFGDMAIIAELNKLDAAFLPIGDFNPRLNAIVWVTNESAIRQAKAADRHLAKRGFVPPPLHGVPFTAKDIFDTAGVATTAGLRKLKNNVPDKDATVIARMRSAGAILLGKSNCPPGGTGGESWNPLHGGTRNPYDLTRSPGASSSGEAAIIAAAGSPLGI